MPPEKKTLKFQMMMSPGEAELLDEWMFRHRLRSRAEAIRRLAQIGLAIDRCSAGEPVAYRHEITEPGKDLHIVYSGSPENPWSHWLQSHLDSCVYSCTPLYVVPSPPDSAA